MGGPTERFAGLRLTHWVGGRPILDPPGRRTPPPATLVGIVATDVPIATTEEVDQYVGAASRGLGCWLALTPDQRRLQVRAVATGIADRTDDLVAALELEFTIPEPALRRHVDRSVAAMLDLTDDPFIGRSPRVVPGVTALVISRHREGKAVMPTIARILMSDSVVILKPSESTPLITQLIAEVANGVLPGGVMNLIHGDEETADALMSNPVVASVFLDGSTEAIDHATRLTQMCGKPLVLYADDPTFSYSRPPVDPSES